MKQLKKNERLIDVQTQTEWMFQCKTRGPDVLNGSKPTPTWTYVFHNRSGDRRFVPERKLEETFSRKES